MRSLYLGLLCLSLLLLAHCTSASPSTDSLSPLTYTLPSSTRWLLHSEADPAAPFSFLVALRHSPATLATMEQRLWAVSEPGSADYGRFLSVAHLHRAFAVSEEVRQTVMGWLSAGGVGEEEVTDWGDTLKVSTSVAAAERVLGVRLHRFVQVGGDGGDIDSTAHSVIRSNSSAVPLPAHVQPLVSLVLGVTITAISHSSSVLSSTASSSPPLSRRHPLRRPISSVRSSSVDSAVPVVVPGTIAATYDLPCHTATDCLPYSSPAAAVGLIEFQGQCFSPSDLVEYGLQMGLGNVSSVAPAHLMEPDMDSSTEGQLDISMVVAVSPAAELWFLYYQDYLFQFVDYFLNASHPVPPIVSISYASAENEACDDGEIDCRDAQVNSTAEYLSKMDVEFMKLGLRGVSVIVASGDGGASDKWYNCHTPVADFPASSAYVTSVGATELRQATYKLHDPPALCSQGNWSCISGGVEAAVSIELAEYVSGGGFSNFTRQPAYQQKAVSAYLASGVALPDSRLFNRSGRGVPDVSALGWNALYYCSDLCSEDPSPWFLNSGTSMSAPIFAGVVSLLLSAFHNVTGHSFGLLNPLLYAMSSEQPATFHDIVLGDNKINATCDGYYTTKGWDPVTGLGTPNFPQMLKYVTKLGERVVERRRSDGEHDQRGAVSREAEAKVVSE